jgi:arginyl-tRNA synthetase
MPSILETFDELFREAFVNIGYPEELGGVQESSRGSAPYQCNGAMRAAGISKKQGKPITPSDVALSVIEKLQDHPMINKLEIGGPGFINIYPSIIYLRERASELLLDENYGIKQEPPLSVIIDYGGANVAKPMHVGHLRSAVIGESIKRILRAQGHNVIGDVHMGDWGLQMGHLISELRIEQPSLSYFDGDITSGFPDTSPVTMDDLARLYPQASVAAKNNHERMELSRIATAELQSGRPGYRALLEHFISVSVAALKVGYGKLGVEFDLWKGEACVDPLIPEMIKELKLKKITEEDNGALIIRVQEEDDKLEIPPVMLLASSGAVLYHTTDMATLVDRKETNKPDRIIYVVDQRQALHFEQVFRAASKAGWFHPDQLYHVGFGTMNGKDGKPFKTREGGVLRLEDLLDIMNASAKNRLEESGIGISFDSKERSEIARKVGLAALKFADLQNQRLTNYTFDPVRFTSFEGKTGPYLLYAVVRIKSILRKAASASIDFDDKNIELSHSSEKELLIALDAFGRSTSNAASKYLPHILCDHVYRVAQAFSRFYADCPILSEDTPRHLQSSRLSLAKLTLLQLEMGLYMLGIEAPERM